MPDFAIRTYDNIAAAGLARFPADRYAVSADGADPDAILVRSSDLHGAPLPAALKAVGRAGSGVNNIPVASLTQRGIPVFNVAQSVLEKAIARPYRIWTAAAPDRRQQSSA